MRSVALGAAAALVGLAGVVVGVTVLDADDRSSSRRPVKTRVELGRVVHVDAGVRSTTFLPLGPGPQDGRTLSAQRAYNLLVSDTSKLQLMPATVQPYYGVLSAPESGPRAVDVRVWAFASESGCSEPGAGRCRLWEFVDARTGRDLGVVTREVLPD